MEKLAVTSAAVVVLESKVSETSVELASVQPEALQEALADQELEETKLPSPCHLCHGRHRLVANESPRCLSPCPTAVVVASPRQLQVQGIERT